jgi:hypothetical protein
MILLALLLLWSCRSLPEKAESPKGQAPKPPAEAALASAVDEHTPIHYTGRYCSLCHEKKPVVGGALYLKYNGNYGELCRCHHGQSPGYCHPLEIDSGLGENWTPPRGFPLTDGKMTCDTCHDVYRQCQKRLFDRRSLRGAPYPMKTDFCYRCHEAKKYKRRNAHHQIRADGTIDAKTCLYCHKDKPDVKTATYRDVTFIGDTRALCMRCHPITGNHPGNFDHMAKRPSAKGLARLAALKKKYHIILPLAEDGKMTCITCHNPHEKGVIPVGKPSAKGAGSKYRERVPKKLCIECHQM